MLSIYETNSKILIGLPESIDLSGNNKIGSLNGQGVKSIFTPFRLASLLNMLQFYAATFYGLFTEIEMILMTLMYQRDAEGDKAKVSGGNVATAKSVIEHLRPECERVQMKRTLERLDKLERSLKYLEHNELNSLIWEYEEIQMAGRLDLKDKLFAYLPSDEAIYYEQDDLFGVKDKFPKANEEITFAGNCYATGNYTACVFHLMRVVEIGARIMIVRLGAKKHLKNHLHLSDWGDLTTAIQEGLKPLKVGTRKSLARKEKLEFYNHAVALFMNFRDAWRNNVAHTRKIYQPGETKDIMNSTERFMQHLATRLKE